MNPKFYYRLDSFYANHRTFIRSRSYDQLKGKDPEKIKLTKCEPVDKVSDLLDWWSEQDLPASVIVDPENTVLNPCGNIAKY